MKLATALSTLGLLLGGIIVSIWSNKSNDSSTSTKEGVKTSLKLSKESYGSPTLTRKDGMISISKKLDDSTTTTPPTTTTPTTTTTTPPSTTITTTTTTTTTTTPPPPPTTTTTTTTTTTARSTTRTTTTKRKPTPKIVKYRHSLNENLHMFSNESVTSLRDMCMGRYSIYEIELETDKNSNCFGPEIKAFIGEIINEIILCFPRKNRPSQSEVNKAIDEAHKRYCIVHKMMKFKKKNVCFQQSHYESCIHFNTVNIFLRTNILKFILLITEGETYPFNKDTEDDLHCGRLKFSIDCFRETAMNCSSEIKDEANGLASEYWSAMSCVER